MPRLKDRSRQIPNSLRFREPSTNWSPPLWSSFDTIVDLLLQHRRANPYLAKKNNWALDRRAIADEVDAYNAALCKAHGWVNFIDETEISPPKPLSPRSPSLSQGVGAVVAGAKIIVEMFGSEGPIRDKKLANDRALTCAVCPLNGRGNWTRFFTVPAQAMVRKLLGMVKDLGLQTDLDEELGICEPCGCPLKGKVWARTEHILKHIPAADKAALHPGCWITKEEQELTHT